MQVVQTTDEEKRKMYSKHKKDDIISMLIECNKQVGVLANPNPPELTIEEKATLNLGMLRLVVKFSEELMESKQYSEAFSQKLKHNANSMIREYNKILDLITVKGVGDSPDDAVLIASFIELALRKHIYVPSIFSGV